VKAFLTAPVSEDGCGLSPTQAEPYLRAVALATTIKKEQGQVTNRLEKVTRGGLIGGVATGIPRTVRAVVYDANGNLTDDGTYLYDYDPLNRQAAVRLKLSNQILAQYFYESSGERVAVIRYDAGAEAEYTVYLRDGASVLYETSFTLPSFTEKSEKTYVYAPGGMGVTRQTAYLPGPATTTFSYYAVDHLGTVRGAVTVDAGGTETARSLHDYEPYGLEIPPIEASLNTHRYTGQERDVETENDYMHFRFYGSNMGRFMKPDNISGNMANPQSWNLYSYVGNNPVKRNDPTGHMWQIRSLKSAFGFDREQDSQGDDAGGESGGGQVDKPVVNLVEQDVSALDKEQVEALEKAVLTVYAGTGIDIRFSSTWAAGKPLRGLNSAAFLLKVAEVAPEKLRNEGVVGQLKGMAIEVYKDVAKSVTGAKDAASWVIGRALGYAAAHEVGHGLWGTVHSANKDIMNARHIGAAYWGGPITIEHRFSKKQIELILSTLQAGAAPPVAP
jgi:RHS repeat-associated protein